MSEKKLHSPEFERIRKRLDSDSKKMMNALWELLTSNKPEWVEQYQIAESIYQSNFLDIVKNEEMVSINTSDYSPNRELNLLINELVEYKDPVLNEKINTLWNELHFEISSYKTKIEGNNLSDIEFQKKYDLIKDSNDRKNAWIKYMKLGGDIASRLIELVKLRNKVAKHNGYNNYYEMKLNTQEIELSLVKTVIKEIRSQLDPIYKKMKAEIDLDIGNKFRIDKRDIRSWHYEDPFFQSYSTHKVDNNIDPQIIISFLERWMSERGIELTKIISQSDLVARSNKSPANFCLNIDRRDDIRISCNYQPNNKGVGVLLHELGHAVYEKEINNELPFLMRQPAHIFLSEGIAILFESLTDYIIQNLQNKCMNEDPNANSDEYKKALITKLYWIITLVEFEQELYKNPEQNLNELWWNIVEDVQGIQRPAEWDFPYWARKAHITTLPVYYQNYLLGEVIASQLEYILNKKFNRWYTQESIQYLSQNLFRLGLSQNWESILRNYFQCKLETKFLIGKLIY
ncbi:M2 family metallopeptidase [Cytobacillus pseudoceanisediminis]|uniref:M2 family metallopeptidase n=1 Tax=Cytobacillus pseudoceanisediminis TaxID=3051614 RepID=UPI003C2F913F